MGKCGDIEKVKEVINTLIYKTEATGDPSYLRLRNRDLAAQIEKLKLNEVHRNKEVEDLRAMVNDLKNEVTILRDKLDDAEEDRRKARESYGIIRRRLRKYDVNEDLERKNDQMIDKGTLTEEKLTHLPGSYPGYKDVLPTENLKPKKPELGDSLEPEKKTEILSINKQIKNLIRRKVELRKNARKEGNESGGDSGRVEEKSLPQRIPRNRPKIISDISLVPPTSEGSTRKSNIDEDQEAGRGLESPLERRNRGQQLLRGINLRNSEGTQSGILTLEETRETRETLGIIVGLLKLLQFSSPAATRILLTLTFSSRLEKEFP